MVNFLNLEYFYIDDFLWDDFVVEVPSSLSKAFIHVGLISPKSTEFDNQFDLKSLFWEAYF